MVDHSTKSKTIPVTGGTESLGGLIARSLVVHDAETIATHYNSIASKADADVVVTVLQTAGAKAVALQGDLTNAMAMEGLSADATAVVDKPDVAINTIGKALRKSLTEISETEYDETSVINARSAFSFSREAGRHANDSGETCTLATSLLGAYISCYAAYAGVRTPVEHPTRAVSKESDVRGTPVTAIGPDPMDMPFFRPAESAGVMAYHKTAAASSSFSRTGLTGIKGVVSFIRHLVSEGWWVVDQIILINGGYATK